jgi:hypothetical protein
VVEGARLERVYTGNRIEGSNPSLSARTFSPAIILSIASLSNMPLPRDNMGAGISMGGDDVCANDRA